jgi:hypothetical protein
MNVLSAKIRRHVPRALSASAILLAGLMSPRPAHADPAPPELIERIAGKLKAMDDLEKHMSVRVDQHQEVVDGDGKVTSTTDRVSRVETNGKAQHETIDHCVKDGKDITVEEQAKATKAEAAGGGKGKDDDSLEIPFTSAGYVYEQVGVDPADPSRVEISFKPAKPSKHTVDGKAWVDQPTGTILSASARLSKPPMFVDWLHFTVELGAKTPAGQEVSRITFEGKGGLLFIHMHLRGEVTMSDYRFAP